MENINCKFDSNSAFESLYIHWPFCPYKCHFCPFVALASHDHYMDQYHSILLKEIQNYVHTLTSKRRIQTIFLGGGTPSTYPVHLLLDTFDTLNNVFDLSATSEISIEVNPGTVTKEKLEAWKQAGINRLSIGVQSLNDSVLKSLNRHQTIEDVKNLLDYASLLFENISIDMILGLPGIAADAWKSMLNKIKDWPIKHISVYFLTVHEDTPLYFGIKKKKVFLPPDEDVVDLYIWTKDFLQQHNFNQYEISNFAQPGFESRHNSAYWNRVPYKGFGLGACSFDGRSRFQNKKNLMDYLQDIEQGRESILFCETLSNEQEWLEIIMLGLRQAKGVSIDQMNENLSGEQRENLKRKIDLLCEEGLLNTSNNRLFLTPLGLAVENEVILTISSF